MAMTLDEIAVEWPDIDIRTGSWDDYLGLLAREDVAPGLSQDAGDAGYHVRLGDSKSAGSDRAVPMADRVAAELELHFQCSLHQGDDELVFLHPATRAPLDKSRIRRRFICAVKKPGARAT